LSASSGDLVCLKTADVNLSVINYLEGREKGAGKYQAHTRSPKTNGLAGLKLKTPPTSRRLQKIRWEGQLSRIIG